jgi:hypothetical protein
MQATLQPLEAIRRQVQLLTGHRCDPIRATEFINLTLKSLWHDHSWSLAKQEATLTLIPPKTTGTVTLQADPRRVLGTGTSFTMSDFGAYLRVSTQVSFLRVLGVSGQLLTLEAPYPLDPFVDQPYTLFRHVYPLPSDFRTFISPSYWDRLEQVTPHRLNTIDPQRLTLGSLPTAYALRGLDETATPVVEIWPVPNAALAIRYSYLKALPPYGVLDGAKVVPLRSDLIVYAAAGEALITLALEPMYADQAPMLMQLGERRLAMSQAILQEALQADQRNFGVPDSVPVWRGHGAAVEPWSHDTDPI